MSRSEGTPGAKGPDELRRDIARSRSELADTVAELAGKADVRGRAGDKAARVAHQVRGVTPTPVRHAAATVARAGRDHPRPVLAAAAGAAVVVAVARRRRR